MIGRVLNLRHEHRVRPGNRPADAADHFSQADFWTILGSQRLTPISRSQPYPAEAGLEG
jgi:hypothetical protein